MAVKLSSLRISNKVSKWIHLSSSLSSMPCASNIQTTTPENDHTLPNSSDFEAKIRFLKNQLQPNCLISVLDSTDDLNSSLKLFKWASLQKRFQHSSDTYFRIILKLGMAGMIDEMEGFCNEMVKEKFPGTEEALLALIDSFVRNSKLSEALRVLFTLNSCNFKPSIGVFNVLLGALVEGEKGFQSVLFVYKEMVKAGVVPTVETLNYLLEALFEADRVDTALDQYRRMGKKGCCPNTRTFEVLINGLVSKNRVDDSIVFVDEILELGCEPDLSFYTSIMPIYCRMNKPDVGMKLFKMMRASKMVPDPLTYEVLIECLCKNLCIDDAITLLDEMINADLATPDHVFVDMINGFCILNKFEEAIKFLEGRDILETNSHNALLGCLCDAGNFLRAKGLFDKMLERDIADIQSWNIIIRFLSENAMIDKALEFLCRMIVSSFIPDSTTYSALIVGKCRSSEIEDALELFHDICTKCWVLDSVSYADLVVSLCQMEKIQEADEVFSYMSSNKCALLSTSFDMLIDRLCKKGKLDRAIWLLSLTYYSGTFCSNATYRAIMLGLSKLNKVNDLLVMVSRMMVEGYPLDVEAYCIILQSMSALGRTKDCAFFLNLMVGGGLLPDSEILANLLSFLGEHSQLHMVLLAIDKFVSKYEILSPAMYNIMINGLWKEGYKSEACRLLDVMLEKGWVPDAITHGLLIGREETKKEIFCDNFDAQDNISSILAEGLGKM